MLRDEPIAYWRFEEKGGEALVDETTNHPGLLVPEDPDAGTAPSFDRAPGIAGGDSSLAFANTYGFVKNSAGLSFENTAPFTIELWLQPGLMKGTAKHVVGHYAGTSGYRLITDTVLRFERIGASPTAVTSIAHAFDTNTLARSYHIAITYNGNDMTLYVDGAVSGVATANDRIILDEGIPFTMGARPDGTDRFYGRIDELALYNKALPPNRLEAHRAASERK